MAEPESSARASALKTAGTTTTTSWYGASIQYGWYGTKERATTPTTGLVLMGARLYNAVTGLFTSVDPVPGGNTTAYTYPQDPINNYDIDGHKSWWKRALGNSLLRGAITSIAISAICMATAGIGCAILAGAAVGAALSVATTITIRALGIVEDT